MNKKYQSHLKHNDSKVLIFLEKKKSLIDLTGVQKGKYITY